MRAYIQQPQAPPEKSGSKAVRLNFGLQVQLWLAITIYVTLDNGFEPVCSCVKMRIICNMYIIELQKRLKYVKQPTQCIGHNVYPVHHGYYCCETTFFLRPSHGFVKCHLLCSPALSGFLLPLANRCSCSISMAVAQLGVSVYIKLIISYLDTNLKFYFKNSVKKQQQRNTFMLRLICTGKIPD